MTSDAADFARTPLLDAAGRAMLRRLREHPDAPRWTYAVGDRLVASDLPALERFGERLTSERDPRDSQAPPPPVLQRLAALRHVVPHFRRALRRGLDLARAWADVPTTSRADLAARPWRFVPDGEDLDRLVVYRTAGTTGHPIAVPHHPLAVACYLPLLEHALAAFGVSLEPAPDRVACVLLSAQVRTYTYPTVLSGWRGAGFAKLNLRRSDWLREGARERYLEACAAPLLTGEPVAFAELADSAARLAPRALVSTSLALGADLAVRLRARFGCPVVDWYSMVETGPIAASCPCGAGLHLLPHDLHLELLRPDGAPCAPGERGEITVSGGRNPYLPLLRYRTGDFGRLAVDACPCGDAMPRLVDLEGRRPILFRAADGTPVGAVDISRRLRELPVLRHAFSQRADLSCELTVAPRPDTPAPTESALAAAMAELLGDLPVEVRIDPLLGEDPAFQAFQSELPFPDQSPNGN